MDFKTISTGHDPRVPQYYIIVIHNSTQLLDELSLSHLILQSQDTTIYYDQ